MTDKLIFTTADRSFQLVASYLMALTGIVSAIEIYSSGQQGAKPWPEEDTVVLDALACDRRLTWRPHSLVMALVKNQWPSQISFEVEEVAPASVSSIQLGVLDTFLYGLSQSLLTNLFEQERGRLESLHGRAPSGWPPVWNFGRVVRNAMSHGGEVTIKDDKTHVSWKRLTYSRAENGRRIVNVDLWPGDLFILIREMEDVLP
ncbi:hypothetical protein CWR43_06950 [Rhizobium sullae]|uniref:Uncharacterized protein n=1 Tax=Rhizobium sullae TaxID=50338 RepID=A0A2N0DD58_RHISU|nr:hypothetical protein [Rhizobium sullae]PKA44037.1 hypothetical protein CWR43_06950 [Rhizobium sullae]